MLWIPITLAAAFIQSIRTALQKHMTRHTHKAIITWSRYLFALPYVALYLAITSYANIPFPALSSSFLYYCLLAGMLQIMGNFLLITVFSHSNFAVGSTYASTEAIQTAIIGIIIFGEVISPLSFTAIILGFIGVIYISLQGSMLAGKSIIKGMTSKQAIIGLLSGTCFGFTSFFIRKAGHTLEIDSSFLQAMTTLVITTCMQVVILGIWITAKYPNILTILRSHFSLYSAIGFTSFLGSIGWFTALILAHPAYVRSAGQIELLFCLLITHYIFKEKIHRSDMIGVGCIIVSIILLSIIA